MFHETYGMLPRRVTEVVALELIGKAGEQALLKELQDAPKRAVELVGLLLPDGDPKKLQAQQVKALEIRLQIASELTRIGDEDTAVALECMLQTEEFVAGSGRHIIERTISRIRQRANPLNR